MTPTHHEPCRCPAGKHRFIHVVFFTLNPFSQIKTPNIFMMKLITSPSKGKKR